jgi:hypothetical protein
MFYDMETWPDRHNPVAEAKVALHLRRQERLLTKLALHRPRQLLLCTII